MCMNIYIHTYICSKENFPLQGRKIFQIYTYCLLLNAICFSHDLKKYTTTRFFLQNLKSANILPAYSNSWLDLKFSSLLRILGV